MDRSKGIPLSRYYLRARRFLSQRILHANDTPHKVALGAGLGMFAAIVPFVGFQTAAAVALAALFRANKAICIPMVWVSNPLTGIPIYATCLIVGKWLWPSGENVDLGVALKRLSPPSSWGGFVDPGYWSTFFSNLATLGIELWVGIFVVAIASGIVTYLITRWLVTVYRDRRRHRILQRNLFRSQVRQSAAVGHIEAA